MLDLNKLTKRDLVVLLENVYGIKATTRPRKSTLIALVEAEKGKEQVKSNQRDTLTFWVALVIATGIAIFIVAGVSGVI